jgi:uncharacterized repeat protein (TIGR04076 family)
MAEDPGVGYRVVATVVAAKGKCSAGHCLGDRLEISCHNPAGLCGFFYHHIFADLQTFQFGGRLPWWRGDAIEVTCPDPGNPVTLRLERTQRE